MRCNAGVRILIIIPRFNLRLGKKHRPSVIPIGLAYISSVLKHNGYEVDFLNLYVYDRSIDGLIRETLQKKEYNYILTGGLSAHYSVVKECVDSVRKYAPFSRVILGGGIISSQPDLMFKGLQPDYIVIGEGELTILELLKYLEENGDVNEVDGIGYRGPKDSLVLTNPRKAIGDLDSLPLADYEGLGLDDILENTFPSKNYAYDLVDFPRAYPLLASRSCPYLCTFCFHPIGNKYRQRSIPNIIDEIAFAIKRYKINIIDIYDELFSNDRKRVYDFCSQIKQLSKDAPLEIKWNCQMRVDTIDEELIEKMKYAGCYLIQLGLESYSPIVLRSMRKKITPQQIDSALKTARRLNMTIQGNFIFGDVSETKETAYATLNYWKNNHDLFGGGISLDFIQPYPGTALYKHALRKGIIRDEINFVEERIFETINITDAMTGKEYNQLLRDLIDARFRLSKYQRPLLVKENNGIYETHVKCPYCNVISIYKNYIPPGIHSYQKNDICCRNCRMRFYVVSLPFKLFILIFRIIPNNFQPHLYSLLKLIKRILG